MGIKNLNPLLKSIRFKSKKFTNVEKFLKNNFKDIKTKWPKNLPNGVIHGDLFIDNIFFKNNKIVRGNSIFILQLMTILCMKSQFV